jgi:mono/diheme cytochrome c family protein
MLPRSLASAEIWGKYDRYWVGIGRVRFGVVRVFRRLRPAIGLGQTVALVAPTLLVMALAAAPAARAQTNIDQGKPASELFANYCAVCHKSTRGLANGRGSPALSQFLREHYAASREQAAALAAYVISAGGNAAAPKPERAKTEEPKTQEPKTQEPKPQESKGQGRPPRPTSSASAKPEPDKPGRGRPQGRDEGGAPPEQQENAPVAAAPPSQAPSTGEPGSPSSQPTPELNPTVGASAETPPGDNAPVPRDNIPD